MMTPEEESAQQKQLFDIYSGILFNNRDFGSGKREKIAYVFDCPEYKTLMEKYHIEQIAGEGTAFQRAERLLHWMSPRLKHKPDYDNHVPMNALDLLDYSLDRPENGMNCRNKSVILTECCLALGIYARRVYIMPYSPYDMDNHVVAEIYDPELEKWVMLDPTTDGIFFNGQGAPLSLLELRERFAAHKPAAFTGSEKEEEMNAYIAKNLFRFMVDGDNGFGLADKRTLYVTPAGYRVKENQLAAMEYRLGEIPPDAMRLQKLFADMLERAREKPEPEAWDISMMEGKP
jgi:hypothetical protein